MVVGFTYQQGKLVMERFGVTIPCAIDLDDGTVYVPCRYICEKVLGVSWSSQYIVLTNPEQRYNDALREVPITIQKRYPRTPLALPVDEAALWIGGINPTKVGDLARDALGVFQDELRAEAGRLLWRTKSTRAKRAKSAVADPHPVDVAKRSAMMSPATSGQQITRVGEVRYTFTCDECGQTHTLVLDEEGRAYLIHES